MKDNIRYYLVSYNLVAFSFWLAYVFSLLVTRFEFKHVNLVLLCIAQGLAVLEIVHTILRWVKSPVGSTFAQVASRIFVVVLIYMFYCQNNITDFARKGIYIVSVAWSVTELVRYSFYALSLLGRQPAFLLWMRYTFFIVLYPLGVTGEWFIILAPIVAKGILLDVYTVFTAVVFLAYAYYFPVLYGYMWKQRRAKIT